MFLAERTCGTNSTGIVWDATGQYITGAHQIKFGIGSSYGPAYQNFLYNGDGISQFSSGVPLRFLAYDSPVYEKFYLNNDLGIYGQDTWTFKRISITGGLRWEYLNNDINPQSAPAGRFVGARNFPLIDCNSIKGLSCFKDWEPRLGAVYDVFGNHKTAVKAGIGKYNTPLVQQNLNNFNPMLLTNESGVLERRNVAMFCNERAGSMLSHGRLRGAGYAQQRGSGGPAGREYQPVVWPNPQHQPGS